MINSIKCAGCGVLMMVVLATGCSTTASEAITVERLLKDMSPGFETLALSHQQRLIRQARTVDINGRQFNDDLDKFFLTYRPLRLTIYPMP